MLDEKLVPSQFNDGINYMIKGAVLFENRKLAYKYKKKQNSKNRIKLTVTHICASIDNDLLQNVIDYIYYNYDVDYIEELNFMGDRTL